MVAQRKNGREASEVRANLARSYGITPVALGYAARGGAVNAVEKWDGKLPVNLYGSAPVPFLNIAH